MAGVSQRHGEEVRASLRLRDSAIAEAIAMARFACSEEFGWAVGFAAATLTAGRAAGVDCGVRLFWPNKTSRHCATLLGRALSSIARPHATASTKFAL